MTGVSIVGAFQTPFGKFPDRNLSSLALEGVRGVLADAGATPDDVDAVFFSNSAEGYLTGQECIRGQVALQETGLLGKPIINVENACASGSSAFQLACTAVSAGSADVALAIGAEKLTNPDRVKTFSVFNTGWDIERFGGPGDDTSQSAFMGIYAQIAEEYMALGGATVEDFAQAAVKAHEFGALNPNAQYRELITVEQVLASRHIAGPLSLLMCSPIGDGAAAIVVASAEGLKRLSGQPVQVRSTVLSSGRHDDHAGSNAVTRAAHEAYRRAGLAPVDIDVVEVHDAASPGELVSTEELGLAPTGEGHLLLRSGRTSLGGDLPINPSGGLQSRGHPVGATGLAQLAELTNQLRNRCGERQAHRAQFALAENAGGWLGAGPAAAVVTILGQSRR